MFGRKPKRLIMEAMLAASLLVASQATLFSVADNTNKALTGEAAVQAQAPGLPEEKQDTLSSGA